MPRDIAVKICGITDSAAISAAVLAGARYLGFVFYQKSPRNLGIDDAATLAGTVPTGVARVGLTVDASDAEIDAILARVPLDMLQLHGTETPERVATVRGRYGLPVMKAVGIGGPDDLPNLDVYSRVADQILVDTKPPQGADRPGGNARTFDWRLIAGRRWPVPWMLAGGLTPANVAEAIRLSGARQVDVSSGVESAPGHKDRAAISAFIDAAQS
jgi:phosphoribosylanthranilate isomerase